MIRKGYAVAGMLLLAAILTAVIAQSPSSLRIDAAFADPSGITIYGSAGCGYCQAMMRDLDGESIPYVFRDVIADTGASGEMNSKVRSAGLATNFLFPVMDIRGRIVMRPSFEDVKLALGGATITGMETRTLRAMTWKPTPVKARTVPFGKISSKVTTSDVVIYDQKNSGNARRLTSGLKAAGIPSKVIIIEPFGEGPFQVMKEKLKKSGYGNDIYLPVVEVRGDMIMKPGVNDIKVMLIESLAP
jgi:glutaredoxin